MTNAFDLFGVIIGLNIIYGGWVVGFVAGSPKGLSSGKTEEPADRTGRRTMGFGLIALGAAYTLFSLYRLL
ncbi:hypothetical protein [Sphingomonas sp. 32-62-10]|uniref:hypothetical protein n=1 Tax=Sphingomonas sp. 32-62-10 TaxID=1970436 RepID=UPI000BD48F60|nr:MAG: hypothetical protein B7Z43_02835 [Sphingomonas sp. 12-62-6]OYX38480.1 MAG: hypothetical protein B7Y98_08465 [Sphingomonas sp. 32-62-10]